MGTHAEESDESDSGRTPVIAHSLPLAIDDREQPSARRGEPGASTSARRLPCGPTGPCGTRTPDR